MAVAAPFCENPFRTCLTPSPDDDHDAHLLDYAPSPRRRRSLGLRHAVAILYAIIGIPVGAFFLIASYGHFERAYEADTTRDKRTWRNSGLRYFGSGAPLLASGYLYWRKSWRELDEPSE